MIQSLDASTDFCWLTVDHFQESRIRAATPLAEVITQMEDLQVEEGQDFSDGETPEEYQHGKSKEM